MYLVAISPTPRGKTILMDSNFRIIPNLDNQQPALLVRRLKDSLEVINLSNETATPIKVRKKNYAFGSSCWKQLPRYALLRVGSKITIASQTYSLRHRPKTLELLPPQGQCKQFNLSFLPFISLPLLLFGFVRNLNPFSILLLFSTAFILLGTGGYHWLKHQKPPRADELYFAIAAKSHLFTQNCSSPVPYKINIPTSPESFYLWINNGIKKVSGGDFLCFYGKYAQQTAAYCVAQLFCYYPQSFSLNCNQTGKTRICLAELHKLPPTSNETIYLSWTETESEIPTWCTQIYPGSKKAPQQQWWLDIESIIQPTSTRRQLPKDSRLIANIAHLFDTADFLSPTKLPYLKGIDKLAESIYQQWSCQPQRKNSLTTILGLSQGQHYWLDLVKSGPHTLLSGTTGAGKSTALQAFILGLALRYSPQDLSLILVDYKGGESFQRFATLPQCIGVLTNLKPAETTRALSSLLAEIKYRESINNPLEVLPRILLIIDEFRILAKDHPEIMETIIRLCILGRSLGIYVVLATQQPGGCIDHQIRANAAIRLSLKMLSTSDSQEVLGISGAESLPTPGSMLGIIEDKKILLKNLWIAEDTEIQKLMKAIHIAWHRIPQKKIRLPWAEALAMQISFPPQPPPIHTLHLGMGDYPEKQQLKPVFLSYPFRLQITGSPGVGQAELLWLLAWQLLNSNQTPIHLLSLNPQPFLRLLQKETTWPGHIGSDAASLAEILRIHPTLSGTVIIDDVQAIIQLLERTYHRYHYGEEIASLCNHATHQKLSIAVSCYPNQAHSRIFQTLDSRMIGFLRDPIQIAQLGLSQKSKNLLDRPGKFIFQSNFQGIDNGVAVQPYSIPTKAAIMHPRFNSHMELPIPHPCFIRALPLKWESANRDYLGIGLYGPIKYPPLPLVIIYDSKEKQAHFLASITAYYRGLHPQLKILEQHNHGIFINVENIKDFYLNLSEQQWQSINQIEMEQYFKKCTVLALGNIELPPHLINTRQSQAQQTDFYSMPGQATLIKQKILTCLQLKEVKI